MGVRGLIMHFRLIEQLTRPLRVDKGNCNCKNRKKFRNDAYESSRIYKEKTKVFHNQMISRKKNLFLPYKVWMLVKSLRSIVVA